MRFIGIIIIFLWQGLLYGESDIKEDLWKELPEISNHPNSIYTHYKSEDYNIRKDIDYFELRKFLFRDGKQLSTKYLPFHIVARKDLNSYSRNIIRHFKKLPFADTNLTHVKSETYEENYLHSSPYSYKINGYFIKNDKVIWTINEKKDLLWIMDGIDTEAELATFLWLYDDDYVVTCKYKYKASVDGFIVKKVVRTYPYVNEKEKKAYIRYSTYILDIKKNGQFSMKLEKDEEKEISYPLVIPFGSHDRKMETTGFILGTEPFVTP